MSGASSFFWAEPWKEIRIIQSEEDGKQTISNAVCDFILVQHNLKINMVAN